MEVFAGSIEGAEVVVPCEDLDAELAFFTGRLGFRVETIFPADEPRVAVVAAHGVRLRLQRGERGAPVVLRVRSGDAAVVGQVLGSPGGIRVEIAAAEMPIVLPPLRPSFTHTRMGAGAAWKTGRAGMLYRDLVPDRQGGRFIASHIRIPEGGPVPDYVHSHRVRFQMIFCRAGRVKVVYEDQGAPFVMHAGDAVLQPPGIRHRVLECSPGMEVVEVGCPAEHETHADPDMMLPSPAARPERDFGGQRFVRHEAAKATWSAWRLEGYERRDLGIAAATGGLAGADVMRPRGDAREVGSRHDGELVFWFVLAGGLTLRVGTMGPGRLGEADAVVIPPGLRYELSAPSRDLEVLEVTLPATVA
jgi:quercetin dioxygenase-like cupin family protein